MKKVLPLILFVLTFAATSFAQMMNSTETEVLKLNREYDEAVLKSDVEKLARIYADDYVFTDSDGTVLNKTQSLEDLKNGTLKFESAQSQDVKVILLGDAAIVTGRFDSKGSYKNEPFDVMHRYTMVYAKRKGRWQAVAEQVTPVVKESDQPMTEKALMDRENMLWMLVKEKRLDEFAKNFADDFRGVYAPAMTNKTEELNLVKSVVLDRYTLSDMKISFPGCSTGVVTYRAAVKGMLMNKPLDQTFNVSTVWIKQNGEWKIAAHTKVEASAHSAMK